MSFHQIEVHPAIKIYFFFIGCLATVALFSLLTFLLTYPYDPIQNVKIVVTEKDVIAGQEFSPLLSFRSKMSLDGKRTIQYKCESTTIDSPIKDAIVHIEKGTYVDVPEKLIAPSRLVTEKCTLVYNAKLNPNPFREIDRTYESNSFNLIGKNE